MAIIRKPANTQSACPLYLLPQKSSPVSASQHDRLVRWYE